MDKYQKALNELYNFKLIQAMNPLMVETSKAYEVIQDLVDKNTPMKPETETEYSFWYEPVNYDVCPRCKSREHRGSGKRGLNNYCARCGQRIDWGCLASENMRWHGNE